MKQHFDGDWGQRSVWINTKDILNHSLNYNTEPSKVALGVQGQFNHELEINKLGRYSEGNFKKSKGIPR